MFKKDPFGPAAALRTKKARRSTRLCVFKKLFAYPAILLPIRGAREPPTLPAYPDSRRQVVFQCYILGHRGDADKVGLLIF